MFGEVTLVDQIPESLLGTAGRSTKGAQIRLSRDDRSPRDRYHISLSGGLGEHDSLLVVRRVILISVSLIEAQLPPPDFAPMAT
jgi:hypothetical protein